MMYILFYTHMFFLIIDTSNVPAPGNVVRAEGDDDGKNHRYAENHVFR